MAVKLSDAEVFGPMDPESRQPDQSPGRLTDAEVFGAPMAESEDRTSAITESLPAAAVPEMKESGGEMAPGQPGAFKRISDRIFDSGLPMVPAVKGAGYGLRSIADMRERGQSPLGYVRNAPGLVVGEGAIGGAAATLRGVDTLTSDAEDIGQGRLAQSADSIEKWAGEKLPVEEAYKEGVASDVLRGAGSMLIYLATGGPAGMAGRFGAQLLGASAKGADIARSGAQVAGASAMAIPASGQETYQRAIEFGLEPEEAQRYARYTGPISGPLQVAPPVAVILRRLPESARRRLFDGTHGRLMEAFAAEAVAEGVGGGLVQNIAQRQYDSDQSLMEDVGYRAFIGGLSSSLIVSGQAVGARAIGKLKGDGTDSEEAVVGALKELAETDPSRANEVLLNTAEKLAEIEALVTELDALDPSAPETSKRLGELQTRLRDLGIPPEAVTESVAEQQTGAREQQADLSPASEPQPEAAPTSSAADPVAGESALKAQDSGGSGVVYKRDGSPYQTEGEARVAGKGRKLEGYAPIRVEGGWALALPGMSKVDAAAEQRGGRPDEEDPGAARTEADPGVPDLAVDKVDAAAEQRGGRPDEEDPGAARTEADPGVPDLAVDEATLPQPEETEEVPGRLGSGSTDPDQRAQVEDSQLRVGGGSRALDAGWEPSIEQQDADVPGQNAADGAVGEGSRNQVRNAEEPVEAVREGEQRPPRRKKPLRREDVLRPLLKALNVQIYWGRVKGKRKGYYLPKSEVIRVKNRNDVDTASLEIAYLLNDRIPELKQSWLKNKAFRDELRGLSPEGKIVDGFARFVQLYVTESEGSQFLAPGYYQWFQGFLDRSEYGAAIRQAAEDMHAWHAQDILDRARSKIGVTKHFDEIFDRLADKSRQAIFDDLHGVRIMEESLSGEVAEGGVYETARLTRGAGAVIDGALRFGAPVVQKDGSFKFEGDGLEQILSPVTDKIDDWVLYAVGRSANELMAQGRENLFTPEEIRAMKALETPEFKAAFDGYQEWNKAILDFAQKLNLINPEKRQKWRRAQYLPFYRVGNQEPTKATGQGTEGNWNGIKALTGGSGNLNDVLGNMVQNAAMLIEAAIQNDALLKIADMAMEVRGGGRFLTKIAPDSRPVVVDRDQIRRELLRAVGADAAGAAELSDAKRRTVEMLEQATDGLEDLTQFWIHGQSPRDTNVIAVLRAGKPEYYEVGDPFLLRSLHHFNRPTKHPIVRFLNAFKRIGQTGVTLTLDFMAANFARDTVMASIISRHGFRPLVDSVSGIWKAWTKDEAYRDFIANGGGMSSLHADHEAFRKHLERFYRKRGINYNTVLDTPSKLLYAIERVAESVEMGARVGEYGRASEAGKHPRHAAYMAREIGSDYSMRGDSRFVNFFYDTVMFLKAGQNGLDRIYRGFVRDPNRAHVMAKTGMLALASAGLYMMNRGNPAYEDLEDWDKDVNWHFFIPAPEGTEDEYTTEDGRYLHFRYPKIWQIGGISSIAERSTGALLDVLEKGDADMQELAVNIVRITRDANFIGAMPHALAPLYEQATNRNSFTGNQIEPISLQGLEPWARAFPHTNETMQALGRLTRNNPEWAQVNPIRAEALVRGYFNTWGLYGLQLADAMHGHNKPESRVSDQMVARRFYVQHPRRTRHEQEFYDMLREVEQAHRTINAMGEANRPDLAQEIAENRTNLQFRPVLQEANSYLRSIHSEMRHVRRDPDMTPKDKRNRMNELQSEKGNVLRNLMGEIRREQGE